MDKHFTYCDFVVRGEALDIMDLTGKSDPFIVIKVPTRTLMKRSIPRSCSSRNASLAASSIHTRSSYLYHKRAYPHTDGYKVVYESEIVKANLNPLFQPFRVGFYELCKGNPEVEILIECYDWDLFKPSDFIGSCKVTVQSLLDAKDELQLQITNLKKGGKASGMLALKCAPSTNFDLAYCDFKAHGERLAKKNHRVVQADPYFVVKAPLKINERRSISGYDGEILPAISKTKCGAQTHPATEGYREIYESPVVKNSLSPDWGLFQLSFYDMCRGHPETKLLFECYSYNEILKNKLIGTAEVSVQSIIDTRGKLAVQLLSKKHKKETGIIYLHCKPSNSSTRFRKP